VIACVIWNGSSCIPVANYTDPHGHQSTIHTRQNVIIDGGIPANSDDKGVFLGEVFDSNMVRGQLHLDIESE
jgi:hypothetical protein